MKTSLSKVTGNKTKERMDFLLENDRYATTILNIEHLLKFYSDLKILKILLNRKNNVHPLDTTERVI